MKFNFSLNEINDSSSFKVEFNHQRVNLNSENNFHSFEVKNEGEYQLIISQNPTQKLKWYQVILYCLLGIIQSVFYALIIDNADSWTKKINPYCIVSKVKIKITQTQDFVCVYKNFGMHSFSEIVYPDNEMILEKDEYQVKNPLDAKIKLFHHARKVEPLFILVLIFSIALSINSFLTNKIELAIFCILLSVLFIILNIYFIINSIKLYKKAISESYSNR